MSLPFLLLVVVLVAIAFAVSGLSFPIGLLCLILAAAVVMVLSRDARL